MVLTLLLPATATAQSLDELIKEGEAAEQRGDPSTAVEIYRRALRLHTLSSSPWFHLGRAQAANGLLVDAIQSLRGALQLDRTHLSARTLLAEIYDRSGSPTAAELELREVLRLRPGNVAATRMLAVLLLRQEAPAKALPLLQAARKTAGSDPALLHLMARSHAMLLQTGEAERFYRESLKADGAFSPSWLGLGNLLALKPEGRTPALECLERYVSLEPESEEGHRSLGGLYQDLGETEKAVAHLRRAAAMDMERSETHYRLAAALTKLGLNEEAAAARARFQESREKEEARREADLAYSSAFREGQEMTLTNRLKEAAEKFREAIRIKPDSDAACAMLSKVLFSMRDFAGAEQLVDRALELNPANGEYRYVRGLILLAQNKAGAAEPELELAGRLMPLIGDIFNRLGILASRRGAWKEAVDRYRKAVEAEPEEAPFHLNLANAYEKLGDKEMAEKHRQRHRELTATEPASKP